MSMLLNPTKYDDTGSREIIWIVFVFLQWFVWGLLLSFHRSRQETKKV
jgi:hypothetical protein